MLKKKNLAIRKIPSSALTGYKSLTRIPALTINMTQCGGVESGIRKASVVGKDACQPEIGHEALLRPDPGKKILFSFVKGA